MNIIKEQVLTRVPIFSWCKEIEDEALQQAINLANHPVIAGPVALMPDCHTGYGMPIGGVIVCKNAVIPNAVGVDIGCGMGAIQTNISVDDITKEQLRAIIQKIKLRIPMGEGHCHRQPQFWWVLNDFLDEARHAGWYNEVMWETAQRNIGTLGGGNHFIEVQRGSDGFVWLMLHSGSRNLGYQVAKHYNNIAKELNDRWYSDVPCDDLSFLPVDTEVGQAYIRDMNLALKYAQYNRSVMMRVVKECFMEIMKPVAFATEVNIHHNYAAQENHLGKNLWIHRKGATSAREGQLGIIPGAMGSNSYIVVGLGHKKSYCSCSHGAGRIMSRTKASATLEKEKCDADMSGIVWDGFKRNRGRGNKPPKSRYDLSEAPGAYKNIDEVMAAQEDLIKIQTKLSTMAVLKG